MSYSYLLDLYKAIDHRRSELQNAAEPAASEAETAFLRGRRDCLAELREFLQKNYHQKLPRRLQNRLKTE